jgi:hypothetical protein
MKITLTSDALITLKKLQEQIKSKNQFAQKRFSPIVSQIVVDALKVYSDAQIFELANKLVPETNQKKARLKRLELIAESMDEDSILKLERSVKRNKNSQ